MKELCFPKLKDTVRIKKMPSYCWIIDITEADGTVIHPVHAFFLSLCNGTFDIQTITQIFAGTFRREYNSVVNDINTYIDRYQRYLDWSDDCSHKSSRYHSKDFLYNIKSTPTAVQGRLSTPGSMTMILTHACNFRCIYCFNSSEKAHEHQLTTEEWFRIIDQAKDAGILKCTVSGGEPMMYPDIFAILKHLHDSDILIELCSNGSLIDSEAVRKFTEIGISHVQVSLDSSDEQIHDSMVVTKGTFQKVTNAIRLLSNAGIVVSVKSVLTPLNIGKAAELVDLCHELGVKRMVLDRFDLSNAGRGNTNLFITREQELILEKLIAEKQVQMGNSMSVNAVTMPRCWSNEKDLIRCGALMTSMTILPLGDISVCEKLIDVPEMTVGNVRNQTLLELWNSDRVNQIIRPSVDAIDEPCRTCELLAKCHTGCFAQTLFVSDNPYAADPRCWKATYADNPYIAIPYSREA